MIPTILITVEGGNIQSIQFCDAMNINVIVIDYDNIEAGEKPEDVGGPYPTEKVKKETINKAVRQAIEEAQKTKEDNGKV